MNLYDDCVGLFFRDEKI